MSGAKQTVTDTKPAPEPGSMLHIMQFFGMTPASFKASWTKMTTQDKLDLKSGLANGTLTY